MDERWLPMVGFEDCYAISDCGRVMRTKTNDNTFAGRILKPHTNSSGYLTVSPHKNGKQRPTLIHRMVMRAFVGPCPEGSEVNHKDGVKTNNHADNLEYVTRSENMQHAFDNELQSLRGERNTQSKLTEENVHEVRRRLANNETHASIADCFNVSRECISGVAQGRNWGWLKEEADNVEQ